MQASLSPMSQSRSLLVRKCMKRPSPRSRSVSTIHTGSYITAIASTSWLSIKSVYCIHTILPLATRLPRKSRLLYLRTVAHVRKSRPCIRLLATCALVRARAFYAHLVGGTWACRKTKRLSLLWLSHSQSMNLVNIHHGALLHPHSDLPNSPMN